MKKALSMLEILIAVCLLVPFFVMVSSWYHTFYKNIGQRKEYYAEKNILISKAELGEGSAKEVTKNIYLKTVSQNNKVLEYLIYK